MNEEGNPFEDWPVISSYSRAQAIEDGVLVELDVTRREAGFTCSVALTRAVYEIVNPSDALKAQGQSWAGRAWDLLMILRYEIKRAGGENLIEFAPLFILEPGGEPKPVKLKSLAGPGDRGELVITILLPEED